MIEIQSSYSNNGEVDLNSSVLVSVIEIQNSYSNLQTQFTKLFYEFQWSKSKVATPTKLPNLGEGKWQFQWSKSKVATPTKYLVWMMKELCFSDRNP